METLRGTIERVAAELGDTDFLIDAETGARMSYALLAGEAARASRRYASSGARAGDRIAILLANTPEMVIAFFGAAYGAFIANPVNPRLTAPEVLHILGDSAATVLVTDSAHEALVAEIRQRLPDLRSVLSIDGPFPGAEAFLADAETDSEPAKPRPDDAAMLLYTSGTTGRSKGALLTHRNLAVNSEEIERWLGLSRADRFLCIMPLFHANGLVITVATPLRLGATVILCDRFHATSFWQTVDRHRPTLFGSVATMLTMLLNQADPPAALRRDSLRYALCGSAPVPTEVIERFEARFRVPVLEGYGLTECTCRATFNPPDSRRPGSIGLPIGNQLRLVDSDGADCAPLQPGEIWLRGANVMAGYFRNPDATQAAITPGGWLRTGDVAYRDQDGYVFIVGRKSDMIIRAGENIYPREIEEVLYGHPAIREAAVYGVSDPLYGEEVAAAIVVKEGATVPDSDLRDHCAARLSPHKCPKAFLRLPELPKGPTGKILKSALRSGPPGSLR